MNILFTFVGNVYTSSNPQGLYYMKLELLEKYFSVIQVLQNLDALKNSKALTQEHERARDTFQLALKLRLEKGFTYKPPIQNLGLEYFVMDQPQQQKL